MRTLLVLLLLTTPVGAGKAGPNTGLGSKGGCRCRYPTMPVCRVVICGQEGPNTGGGSSSHSSSGAGGRHRDGGPR